MTIEIEYLGVERTEEFLAPILSAFGARPRPERIGSWKQLDELVQRLAVFDRGQIVGGAGTFAFDMTVPGGAAVSTAGLTTVAVLPTHRRRGIMTALVTQHLRDAREQGRTLSALWASESAIYGRFGYGLAHHVYHARIHTARTGFAAPLSEPGRVRLIDADEALRVLPPIWEQVRASVPGMLSRSPNWWRLRRLTDREDHGGPLQCAVLEVDGQPRAYALYRLSGRFTDYSLPDVTLTALEVVGDDARASLGMWRYVLDVDLVTQVKVDLLPTDHVLIHAMTDMRQLHLGLSDGVWVRILDVEAALAARHYAVDDALTLAVADELFPANTGNYRIDGDSGRVTALAAGATQPDIRLSIEALGAVYLSGVSFTQLAAAGRLQVLTERAAERADALFHCSRAPWCPEIF